MAQRIIRKSVKAIVVAQLLLLFMMLLLGSLIQSSAVQKSWLRSLSNRLSANIGSEVSIKRVKWQFPKTFVFEQILIGDQHHDTLFYIGDLSTSLRFINLEKNEISLNRLSLTDVLVNFKEYSGTNQFNYEFFFDFLAGGPRDPNKTPTIWKIYFSEANLSNATFAYKIEDASIRGRRFNESDFRFEHIEAQLEDFSIVDDSLNFFIRSLALKERNSFSVIEAKAQAVICSQAMIFSELSLRTEFSYLKNHFAMHYQNWRSFNNFNTEIELHGVLENAEIDFKDIAYFSDDLKDWTHHLTASGQVKGPLAELKAKDVNIDYLKKTKFIGSGDIIGLPDSENMLLDIQISSASTNISDLSSFLRENLKNPYLERLGEIHFNGNFTGLYHDFVAFGVFNTAAGEVVTDLNMKLSESNTYSGKIALNRFNLGSFLNNEDIGTISMTTEIEGEEFDWDHLSLKTKSTIFEVEVLGYPYQQILFESEVAQKVIIGDLSIQDPHLGLRVNGKVALNQDNPLYQIKTIVKKADLASLGWDKNNPTSITFSSFLNIRGSDVNNLEGEIALLETLIERNQEPFYIDSILFCSNISGSEKLLELQSDVMDARIKGSFSYSNLTKSWNNILASLLPNTLKLEKHSVESQHFEFAAEFKRTREFIALFSEGTWIGQGDIKGVYVSDHNFLSTEANLNKIHYKEYEVQDLKLSAEPVSGIEKTTILSLKTGPVMMNDSLLIQTTRLDLTTTPGLTTYSLGISGLYNRNHILLDGDIGFEEETANARISKSVMDIGGEIWTIDTSALISFDFKDRLLLESVIISRNNEKLSLNGDISKNKSLLELQFDQFGLKVINQLMPTKKDIIFGGVANGYLNIRNLNADLPSFTSDFSIKSLELNGDTLGDLFLKAKAVNDYKLITVSGSINNGSLQNLEIGGFIKPEGTNNLTLNASIKPTTTNVLQPFLKGVVSNLNGQVSANVKITGNINSPTINGFLKFDDAGFTVDYLKTRYLFSHSFKLDNNRIDLGSFILRDENKGTAQIGGYLSHQLFTNFKLNIEARQIQNLMVLNTKENDDDYYYGQAIISGSAKFSGSFENLRMDVNAKSEKGSAIYIPLENYGGTSEMNFINFVNFNEMTKSDPYQDLSGIEMNFDLALNPNAEIQIIFDSKLGDIIKARGNGNLSLRINSNGDFKMFGDYEVVSGDYLFTALSLINKRFVINPGGTITWNGDPLNANLNLVTRYKTRTSPENLVAGLVSNEDLQAYKQPTDVEALMRLRGNLSAPEIRFGIHIPDLSNITLGNRVNTNTLLNVIKRIENDQEEMTRQVFSLLVANMFIRPALSQQFDANAASGEVQNGLLSSSVGDLLSNQISNWLGQINSGWNLGINYLPGDRRANQTDLLISASQKFLNDRLEIQGTIGTNSTVRNISATYVVSTDGRLRVRAFNRTGVLQSLDNNNVQIPNRDRNINTQGVGLFYRIEFDMLSPERKEIRRQLEKARREGAL